MSIRIRKAKGSDAPALASLIRAQGIFARINAEAPEVTAERVGRHLAMDAADDSHLVLVARDANGQIAGYCAVHWLPYLILSGLEGYVSELFVHPDYRGQGIGGLLLEAVKSEAKAHGCSRLSLINMRNRESYLRQFYAKRGWVEREDAANFVLSLEETT
jgi:GNAT superfamily N-acetyltransferase